MSFVFDSDDNVTSFAEYQDVLDRDQRIFDENEGLSDSIINVLLVRATERLVSKLASSQWYRDYKWKMNTQDAFDSAKILSRHNDFTDLCVYEALAEYILPKVANFGNSENSEFNKISFYRIKADQLFGELITHGDWYDFDSNGTVETSEIKQGTFNLRRVR
jgi:hypothetical protein